MDNDNAISEITAGKLLGGALMKLAGEGFAVAATPDVQIVTSSGVTVTRVTGYTVSISGLGGIWTGHASALIDAFQIAINQARTCRLALRAATEAGYAERVAATRDRVWADAQRERASQ